MHLRTLIIAFPLLLLISGNANAWVPPGLLEQATVRQQEELKYVTEQVDKLQSGANLAEIRAGLIALEAERAKIAVMAKQIEADNRRLQKERDDLAACRT